MRSRSVKGKRQMTRLHSRAQACCDKWNRLGMREKQRAAWALIERIEATNEYIRIFWKL